MDKPVNKIRIVTESAFQPIQNHARSLFARRKYDECTMHMAEVPTLVASVTPTLNEDGHKTGEDIVVLSSRLHPRNQI